LKSEEDDYSKLRDKTEYVTIVFWVFFVHYRQFAEW